MSAPPRHKKNGLRSCPFQVKNAVFTGSFQESATLPSHNFLELCLLGRSNVGKSSLLNRLAQRHGLARVSNTPGRTQALNRFELTYQYSKRKAPQTFVILDLPGFGFAAQGREKMESYGLLLEEYLEARKELRMVFLLQDPRREPGEEELAAQRFAFERGLFFVVVATKCDKLTRNELTTRLRELAARYGLAPNDIVLTGEGLELTPLWQRIELATLEMTSKAEPEEDGV